MTWEVTFKPCSLIFSPAIKIHRSPETSLLQVRLAKSGKAPPSTFGSASLTSPSGAPFPVVGFHSRTTSKQRSILLFPVCTAFTSTLRPGICLRSWASPSQGIHRILGMRTHLTRGPTSDFALSLAYNQIRTGRSWATGFKALGPGVPS